MTLPKDKLEPVMKHTSMVFVDLYAFQLQNLVKMMTENTERASRISFINCCIYMLRCKHTGTGKTRIINERYFQSSQEQ